MRQNEGLSHQPQGSPPDWVYHAPHSSLSPSLPPVPVCVYTRVCVCVQVQIDVTLNCINLLLGDLALIALRVQVGACGVAEAKRSFRSRAFFAHPPSRRRLGAARRFASSVFDSMRDIRRRDGTRSRHAPRTYIPTFTCICIMHTHVSHTHTYTIHRHTRVYM